MPVIAKRFCGPSNSGNGGYVCGLIGTELGGVARIRLTAPPPLDRPLSWRRDDDALRLTHKDTVIGEGTVGSFAAAPPPMVDFDEAAAAAAHYPGPKPHLFPRCFTCGNERGEGDGLRIFSSPVSEGVSAAPWTPHLNLGAVDVVGEPVTWAAIDCAGAWAAGFDLKPRVLGQMTGEVLSAPRIGRDHVVIGQVVSEEGRFLNAATAVYTAEGELIARSEQVWVEIDISKFS